MDTAPVEFGYTLSSEEFAPGDLMAQAIMAEDNGFTFASVSDHFHPWTSSQGHSPFVWTTLGAAFARTTTLRMATGVTCPLIRIHPVIVAQAAATTAVMSGGRFSLGVGTGEALNEHVTGERWPHVEQRQEMLIEAISIMRALWTGETLDHAGEYYTVDNARLFTVPETPPPVIVAAAGEGSARLAAEHGDGLWCTSPNETVIRAYRDNGGAGPVYGQVTVCYAKTEEEGLEAAHRIWPTAAVPGQLSQDLPTWTHFEQVAQLVKPEMLKGSVAAGPEVEPYVDAVRPYLEAGVDHLHFHQIGPDQSGFMAFWRDELRAAIADRATDRPLVSRRS